MMQKPHHARPRTAKPRRARQAAKQTPAAATPNDPMWPSSWGMRALDMPAAWRLGQGAPKVVVAVLDTGVDSSQPDLAGALVPGWNAITNTADTSDTYGHGTEVAGVIAARANNHLGGSGYCARCAVMPVKVLDGAGGGSSTTVAAGIRWAAAHGATVLNLSLVLAGRDPAVSSAIADATAQGLLVVASAGNDGGTSANYPAADPGAISVAAADPSDALYPWSNHGSWITVSAPGCNEATTVGNGYAEFCGTSSATAAVSGVLALAVADCGCSAATVSRALTATAKSGSPPRVDGGALVASLSADSTRRPT
jgi:thermitase